MSRSVAERGVFRALSIALLAAVALGVGALRSASAATRSSGFELGDPISRTLHQVQDQAVQWLVQADPERSGERVTDLLETVRQLGFSRLPDLSRGALLRAVERAGRGDFDLAHQALEAAERFDPGRPENSFAAATVARLEGRYAIALGRMVAGVWRSLGWPFERRMLLDGALTWILWLLLTTAGLFLAIQMVAKGGALLSDTGRIFSDRSSWFALPFAVAVLIWPLVLPSGLIWLLLWWSVLFWGYASSSERTAGSSAMRPRS